MMCTMTDHWARLGAELKAAGKARGLQQKAIAEAIGVGRGAIANIEKGDIKKVSPTVRAYARLVGWTDDSPERVLAGGEPMPTPQQPALEPAHLAIESSQSDLSLRVRQALEEGPLVDSQVLTLRTPGGELRATIVVRGEPDASPEELHDALVAWRDREAALRRLSEDADQ